jgi:hypothetical protein
MKANQTTRRRLLQAAGISMPLPMLESDVFAAKAGTNAKAGTDSKARRLVCVGFYLGFHQKSIYPKQAGRDYELTPLLKPVAEHREDFTVFSGLDHRAANGHKNWSTFLTGKSLGSVSLDQIVAEQIGGQSRFQSIEISAGKVSRPMNFTRGGVALPAIARPSVLYKKLFASPEDEARTDYLLETGQSALDKVLAEAKRLRGKVSLRDREKLDEYFASVRDVEKRVQKQLTGQGGPVPRVDYKLPDYDPIAPTLMLECEEIMYDLIALALETDSTRVMSMNVGGLGQVFTLDGRTLRAGYHALSHHGNDPDKIRDLVRVEEEHMKRFAGFLSQLKRKTDAEGRPLLDTTLVLFGTGMGDSSRHSNQNLPTLVAGGGLKHGQHVAIKGDRNDSSTPLLGDLYLTLMQQLGLEAEVFSNANRNLNEHLI